MVDNKTSYYLLLIVSMGLVYTACGPGGQQQSEEQRDTTSVTQRERLNSDVLLVPGESAGNIRLFDADSTLFETFGQPDFSDAAMGKALLVWYTGDGGVHYPLSVFTARNIGNDETARVQQIRITAPFYTTAEGVCATSTLEEINKHYETETVETYERDGQQYTIHDSKQGIAFEVGPDERSVAAIIHVPDANASTYLSLRAFE